MIFFEALKKSSQKMWPLSLGGVGRGVRPQWPDHQIKIFYFVNEKSQKILFFHDIVVNHKTTDIYPQFNTFPVFLFSTHPINCIRKADTDTQLDIFLVIFMLHVLFFVFTISSFKSSLFICYDLLSYIYLDERKFQRK